VPEGRPGARAIHSRCLLQIPIYQGKGLTGRIDEQRGAHKEHAGHDAGKAIGKVEAKMGEPSAQKALAAKHQQEGNAGSRVRDDQRQIHEACQRQEPGKASSSQDIGQWQTEDQADDR